MALILLVAFIALPIIEIAVIIKVGGLIGAWPTVGVIILTAAAGTALVRAQGFQILARAQDSLARGQFPAAEMFEGMNLMVAGLLLLTPGFVTDAFGLVLLIPPFRRAIAVRIWQMLLRNSDVHVAAHWPGSSGSGDVIEGEYREVRPAPPPGIDRKNEPGNPADRGGTGH